LLPRMIHEHHFLPWSCRAPVHPWEESVRPFDLPKPGDPTIIENGYASSH
jgi:hypothetical protein